MTVPPQEREFDLSDQAPGAVSLPQLERMMPGMGPAELLQELQEGARGESEASLESALGRIREEQYGAATEGRERQYGSASDPITLTGNLDAPLQPAYNSAGITDVPLDPNVSAENQVFNPESPAWRKADKRRTTARTNASKAENIRDYLAANAGGMDPQQYQAADKQAGMLEKTVADYEKREITKREKAQGVLMKTQEILGKIEQERIKGAAGVEREDVKGQYKTQQETEDNFNDLERMLLTEDDEDLIERIVMAMAQLLDTETGEGEEAAADRIRTKYGL